MTTLSKVGCGVGAVVFGVAASKGASVFNNYCKKTDLPYAKKPAVYAALCGVSAFFSLLVSRKYALPITFLMVPSLQMRMVINQQSFNEQRWREELGLPPWTD